VDAHAGGLLAPDLGPLTAVGKVDEALAGKEVLLNVRPEFGATFASSQVDGIARQKCFHYA
jgi:hypothetical protein